MSVNNPGSSGASGNPSGTTDDPNKTKSAAGNEPGAEGDPAGTPGNVAYETHRKLLGEKKKLQEERDALASKIKQQEEADLVKRGETDKLLKLREEELATLKGEKLEIENRFNGALKLDSVLDAIGGNVDKRYWGLIPVGEVVIDPNTGMPDPTSVQKIAKQFEKQFPEIVSKGTGVRLPNGAANGSAEPLTPEAWKKLSRKDKLARYGEYLEQQKKN